MCPKLTVRSKEELWNLLTVDFKESDVIAIVLLSLSLTLNIFTPFSSVSIVFWSEGKKYPNSSEKEVDQYLNHVD